jgi:membrane protease YdiL (CAAX protease family)
VDSSRSIGLLAGAAYFCCYLVALLALRRFQPEAWSDALVSLAIIGGILPLAAIALTRGLHPPTLPAAANAFLPLLAYLVVFSVLVLGFGFSWLHATFSSEPVRSGVLLAVKLVTMIAIPAALLGGSTGEVRPWLAPRWYDRSLWVPLIGLGLPMLAFQAVFGRGLTRMAEARLAPATLVWGIPLCFVWLLVDTGLPEEFLFRVAVQHTVADRWQSPATGVLVGALLFGIAHAPGLYLREGAAMEGVVGRPSVIWSIAYSIAVISPTGILFGTLWARTHSLALVTILHATMDLIPNLMVFLKLIR